MLFMRRGRRCLSRAATVAILIRQKAHEHCAPKRVTQRRNASLVGARIFVTEMRPKSGRWQQPEISFNAAAKTS
jgi:hypothetical protein